MSGFAALLPFIDQQPAWEALSQPSRNSGFPPMGPEPSTDPSAYQLWGVQFDRFICPSEKTERGGYGLRSYLMCYGDGVKSVGRRFVRGKTGLDPRTEREQFVLIARGAFVPGTATRLRDMVDGMSNTILMSETAVEVLPKTPVGSVARNVAGLTECPSKLMRELDGNTSQRYLPGTSVWSVGKGSRWPEGSFILNAFTTVLPPGSPSGTEPQDPFTGCVSASSRHESGVFCLMGDGAVRFVSDSIDTGDLTTKSVCWQNQNGGAKSPYGVWGAMGTRGMKEIIPSEREAAFTTIYAD